MTCPNLSLAAHCFMKAVPVACLYAGKPELKSKVEEAVRVHQNNDMAVAFGIAAALLLEHALVEGKLPDAEFIETLNDNAKESFAKAAEFDTLEELFLSISHELMKGKEDSPFYDLYGRSCALPGSFMGPSFLLRNLDTASSTGGFAEAIRANILGAGDTCSRAIFLGAVICAANGGPPSDWLEKVDPATLKRVDKVAAKIADLVGAV